MHRAMALKNAVPPEFLELCKILYVIDQTVKRRGTDAMRVAISLKKSRAQPGSRDMFCSPFPQNPDPQGPPSIGPEILVFL